MEAHVNWELPVAFDLFTAGLGAGALMIAVLAQLAGDRKYRAVYITGALIAPWPVILGVLLLVIDLGVPYRFWELLIRRGEGSFLMFSATSTMSIGTWLLTLFVIGSLIYLVVVLCTIPFKWGAPVRALFGILMLPFALGVTIYTGVLIAACRAPMWNNTALLPTMFVSSAIACGIASVVFLIALFGLGKMKHDSDSVVPVLEKLTGGVLVFQLLVVIAFLAATRSVPATQFMVGKEGYGALWWVGILLLGVVIPALVGLKGGTKKPQTALLVSALVMLGGFFLRYAILFAGQLA